MPPKAAFKLSVVIAVFMVVLFGAWSISKHVERFGKAQLVDGLPVGEVRDTFEELRTRTASSLQEFSRLTQEATKESITQTSVEEFQEGAAATPAPNKN